jgi:hypothetical protein
MEGSVEERQISPGIFSFVPLREPATLAPSVSFFIISCFGIGPLLALLSIGYFPQAWDKAFAILAWVITSFVAFKFLAYYYGIKFVGRGSGTFLKTGQVNSMEQCFDFLVAILGSVLIWSILYHPILWLLTFCILYALNLCRCYITLKRPKYMKKLKEKGHDVPNWYGYLVIEKVNDKYERGDKSECIKIEDNLKRWVIRDMEYIILCLPLFFLFFVSWLPSFYLCLMIGYYLYKQRGRGFMEIIIERIIKKNVEKNRVFLTNHEQKRRNCE